MDQMRITGQVAPFGGRYTCVRQCGSIVEIGKGEPLPPCPACLGLTGWTPEETSELSEPASSPRGPLSTRPRPSGVHEAFTVAPERKVG